MLKDPTNSIKVTEGILQVSMS